MSLRELLGGRLPGLLPWLSVYHRLALQRDAGGGVGEDEEELLDTLEESLAALDALDSRGDALTARLSTPHFSARTPLRGLTLWEAAVDDSALFDDGQVVRLAVEEVGGRWHHFTGVVQPRRAGEPFRRIELVAGHGVRTSVAAGDR